VFKYRSKAKGREKCQRAYDHNHRDQQKENRGVVTGNVPAEAGTIFFFARLPAIASIGMIMRSAPPAWSLRRGVVPERVAVQSTECGTVVARHGRECIENLRQPVRARVADARRAKPSTEEMAVSARMISGNTSVTSIAIFTS